MTRKQRDTGVIVVDGGLVVCDLVHAHADNVMCRRLGFIQVDALEECLCSLLVPVQLI